MPMAYEGSEPYIFVSYSHRDATFVHRVITHLESAGYRVWFDGGIEAGSEWPEYIASHLMDCSCVLTFISDDFVNSKNCKRELNFAQELQKPVLSVYVDEVHLTAGMRMQLGLSQALFRKNYSDDQAFLNALENARILADCRGTVIQRQKEQPPVQKDVQPEKPVEEKKVQPEKTDGASPLFEYQTPGSKVVGWIIALMEIAYCVIAGFAMDRFTGMTDKGGLLVLYMLIPHSAVMLFNVILTFLFRKRWGDQCLNELMLIGMFASIITSLVASVVGSFFVQFDMAWILKLLISLGLNVAPAILAAGGYFIGMVILCWNDD